jgi:hypothetical protein
MSPISVSVAKTCFAAAQRASEISRGNTLSSHCSEQNKRLVPSETLDTDDQLLAVALTTLEFEPTKDGTNLTVTVQIVSFVRPDMIRGYESGNKSALKNLSQHLGEITPT